MSDNSKQDSREVARGLRSKMDDLVGELRQQIGTVDDPSARALFETSAEVIIGLRTAFEHFENKSEEAWR